MLLGSEIGAALTALEPLGVDLIGSNCATGPAEMSEHLRTLSKHARIPLSVMPNAGLPVLGKRGAEYPLTPDELAEALSGFVRDYGLRLVGGCCGTTPAHVRAVADAIPSVTPARRDPRPEPGVSSLYAPVPFRQDTCGADGGRADQRQRQQGLPRGDARAAVGRLRRDGPRPDPRRRAPDRPQRRLRGPRRRRGHGRAGRSAGHRVDPADHARLDGAGGAARRAGAPGRPVDRQLGELRRRRRSRLALPADDGAGPRARCGGRRAVHRRGGPGPHRRLEGPDRGPADPRPDDEPWHARRGHRRRHPHLPDHHRAGGGPPRRAGDDRGDPRSSSAGTRACRPRWASRTCRSGSTPPPGRC